MIEKFCKDSLWDLNQTWTTNTPDFSSCFKDTILTLIPSVLFCICGLFELWILNKHISRHPLPWIWLNQTKLVINIALLCLCVSLNIIYIYQVMSKVNVPLSTLISSCARSVTFILVVLMVVKHRSYGVVASTTLSVFWIIFSAFSIILQRSLIMSYFNSSGYEDISDSVFIIDMIYHCLIYIQLILSIFADKRDFNDLENGSPFEEATFISLITFSWFNKIIYRSTKKLLGVSDLIPLSYRLKSTYLFQKLKENWNILDATNNEQRGLGWTLMKTFWNWLMVGTVLDIFLTFGQLLPPLVLDRVIDFVNHDQYEWRGTFYCIMMFIAVFATRMIQNNCAFYLLLLGAQVKSVLIASVFRKNLLLSTSARKQYTSGNLLNLISVDVERIAEFSTNASMLITAPLKIVLVIYLMWQYLGPSSLAGMGVILILVPISFYLTRLNEKFVVKQMAEKDIRLKYMNEILGGIKLLKFYAWEIPFSEKVTETRKTEIKFIRLSQLCYGITSIIFSYTPFLMTLTSFATFILINSENVLTPTRIFVTLSLVEQLKYALFEIPDAVSQFIQALSSIDRLRKFLIANQQDSQVVGSNTKEGEMLAVRKATLSWSPEAEPTLENIDLSVSSGKLIAITGPVGAGKSSLLSAILGEMYKTTGTIDLKASIAYVPQQAWIQNRSLKNNILFVKPMKEDFYRKVLDCCCLRPDLDILPASDETEIGEKGINLSGGQKQRVSLARAVYQNKDIYILDDPLSAVDVHVRKALFDDVIGNNGLLQKKTRILVTHDISVLPGVDFIVTIKDGKIVETGTYSELMNNEGTFSAFITEHANSNAAADTTEQSKTYGRSLSRFVSTDSGKSKKSLERSSSEDKSVKKLLEKQDMATLIEEEKMEIGGVKRGVYINYVRHFSLLFFIPTVLGFISYVTFEAGANVWLSKWNADAQQNTTNTTSTTWRLSIYAAFLSGQALSYTVAITALLFGSTVAAKLYHKEMLDCILRCPMSFFDTTPLGRIMNRFSADMDIADMQIVYVLEGWFDCLFFVTSGFIVIGIYTPIFLTTLLPLGIMYYLLQKLHLTASRQIKRLESTTRSPLYSYFLESIQGVSSIKAYEAEKEFIENFDEILDKHITCYVNTLSCNSWLHFWLDILGCLMVLVATTLAIGHRDYLGAAVVALMITYSLNMKNAAAWIVRMNTELENKSVSIERIDEYTHLESEADWRISENEPLDNWPNKGEIIFDSYSTKYRKDLDLALKEIDFHVNSNEKVGIVGRTGAGKSSVTLALFRVIEPVKGTIFIDDTDVSKIGLHTLRSNLSIIPQDPVLFTGSLRFNLDPNNDYEDEEIWRSLDSSNLKDFVSSLNKGLEHEVEEGGLNLSAGQRQLFCLARALLKKTKILVLDEATAAVDMDTDQRIQTTIRTALADHTVITIAHRLNTVIDYDKVIVMDSGKIAEIGKPDDLLQNKESVFYRMAKDAGLV